MHGRTEVEGGAVDRRTLIRRAGLAGAGAGLAGLVASSPAHAANPLGSKRAAQHLHPNGSDANPGTSADHPKRSWTAAIDALPPEGGVLAVAQGLYETGTTVSIGPKPVEVVCEPGAVLRATAPMEAVLIYGWVVDEPGVGVHGLTVDMNGLAATGLAIRNCWLTDHTLKVLNPGGGTGVRIYTDHDNFGCYYNRVLLKCSPSRGQGEPPVAGSTGILLEGEKASNKTNHNTLVDCRIGNVETGIRVGAFTDANTIVRADCTGCSIGYDLTTGATHLLHAWDEGNGRGVVVRSGAVAHMVSTLYSEQQGVEGTGVLHRDGDLVAGPNAATPIDRVRQRVGGPKLRERFNPRDGSLAWMAGAKTLTRLHQSGKLERYGYDEYVAIPAPRAPGRGRVRLFTRTARGGGAELCARLPSGRVVALASDGPAAGRRSPADSIRVLGRRRRSRRRRRLRKRRARGLNRFRRPRGR